MSQTIHDEPKLSLAEAARGIPGHRGHGRLHPSTLTRWIQRGCRSAAGRRVRLEAVRCGGRWLTSDGALARFMVALTDESGDPTDSRTPSDQHRGSEAAARELSRLGA